MIFRGARAVGNVRICFVLTLPCCRQAACHALLRRSTRGGVLRVFRFVEGFEVWMLPQAVVICEAVWSDSPVDRRRAGLVRAELRGSM